MPIVAPRAVDAESEPHTLAAMDEVMQHAYDRSSFGDSIDRFVAAQPDGLCVVELDGRVVGAGCCVAYPSAGFGWIGLIATEPGFERRGIATAITEHLSRVLEARGCGSVLDASAAGAPVYQRMSFDDHGLTTVVSPGDELRLHDGESCELLSTGDLEAVVAFDAARFGAPRAVLLSKLLEQQPGRAFVLRRGGQLAGYLVAQDATLAPVVADDAAALAVLLSSALRLDFSSAPRINVPPDSGHLDALLALGFEQRRQLRHMHRGIGQLPGRRECVAGMVSLGEG